MTWQTNLVFAPGWARRWEEQLLVGGPAGLACVRLDGERLWQTASPERLDAFQFAGERLFFRVHFADPDRTRLRAVDALNGALSSAPSPSVLMVPRWGADARYSGQQLADTLNDLSRRWQVLEQFGTNPVLVNYSSPTPWGDPAFAIATLR